VGALEPHGSDRIRTDHELSTLWGVVLEACVSVTRQVGTALDQVLALPGPWFEVLLRVSNSPRGRAPMSELAGGVSITPGGVTKLIDRMAAQGLVTRVPHPTDRRVVYVTLTDSGRATLATALAVQAEVLRSRLVGPLGFVRTEVLLELMSIIRGGPSPGRSGRPGPARP
jgi:DNA-binding MarR family transcriptional regulator